MGQMVKEEGIFQFSWKFARLKLKQDDTPDYFYFSEMLPAGRLPLGGCSTRSLARQSEVVDDPTGQSSFAEVAGGCRFQVPGGPRAAQGGRRQAGRKLLLHHPGIPPGCAPILWIFKPLNNLHDIFHSLNHGISMSLDEKEIMFGLNVNLGNYL